MKVRIGSSHRQLGREERNRAHGREEKPGVGSELKGRWILRAPAACPHSDRPRRIQPTKAWAKRRLIAEVPRAELRRGLGAREEQQSEEHAETALARTAALAHLRAD